MNETAAPEIGQDVLFGIAQLALEQVDGMTPLAPPPRVGEFLSGRRAKGIRIDREGQDVDIALNVTVRYGLEIPKVATQAQRVVREAVGSMTGLHVRTVKVAVVGIDVGTQDDRSDDG